MRSFTQDELETIERLRTSSAERVTFFERHRTELKHLTNARMVHQLKRRIDGSDIIQDAFVKYCNDLAKYLVHPRIPPVVWLRRLVRQVIFRVNRTHLTTKCRDMRRELPAGKWASVNLDELAASISSVASHIGKKELRDSVRQMLETMTPREREILTLVHFESMSLRQAANVIGISLDAAKKRYCRSLKRLRKLHELRFVP